MATGRRSCQTPQQILVKLIQMKKYIALHSVPRSGSSWLGEIINSSPNIKYAFQPLFSYAFKGQLTNTSSVSEIETFYDQLKRNNDEFVCQTAARASSTKPTFAKANITHIAYKEVRYHYVLANLLQQIPEQKVIGLVRHPLAVLSSWKAAPREFRTDLGWSFEQEWREAKLKNQDKPEEYFGFNKWKEVALLYKALEAQFPDQFKLVHYSNLLADTMLESKSIFEFLDLEFSQQSSDFICSANSNEVADTYSVFRNKSPTDNIEPENLSEEIMQAVLKECQDHKLDDMLI